MKISALVNQWIESTKASDLWNEEFNLFSQYLFSKIKELPQLNEGND